MPNADKKDGDDYMPYSSNNGVKIYYEVSGKGFPLVLVHANPFDHDLWMFQTSHFSSNYKVIAPDLRGYGGPTSRRISSP